MKYAVTKNQMIEAENIALIPLSKGGGAGRRALKADGVAVSVDTLISRAASACAEIIMERFDNTKSFLIVCGSGNNGKDGYGIAQILKDNGYNVDAYSPFTSHLSPFTHASRPAPHVIIDAVFGIGLNKNIDEKLGGIFDKINNSGAYIISIDIPSGLNADNGLISHPAPVGHPSRGKCGKCIKADLTIAINYIKTGCVLNDGRDMCGEIVCTDNIGIKADNLIEIFEKSDTDKYFPPRKSNTNKGSYGRVSVIAGSKQTPGAAVISYNALSALLCGCGYAQLCIPESLYNIYALHNPEITYKLLKDNNGNVIFDKEALAEITVLSDVIVIGMGVSVSSEIYKTIEFLLQNFQKKLIIDADALNCLSKFGIDILKSKKPDVLLTPHIKEFSRLRGFSVNDILNNQIEISKAFAAEYDVKLLLKNNTSLITDGQRVNLCINGTPALAKAGSGDVLSGIISGIAARGYSLFESAACGSEILAEACICAENEKGAHSVIARDVINKII